MPNENANPLPKNYQWPADKLTAIEMAILHRLRQETGRPINHLLREAVLMFKIPTKAETEILTQLEKHHAEKE